MTVIQEINSTTWFNSPNKLKSILKRLLALIPTKTSQLTNDNDLLEGTGVDASFTVDGNVYTFENGILTDVSPE